MMRSHITLLTTILLLSCPAANLLAENNNTHRNQVETLFKLTQMEKKIEESVDSVVQLQLRQNPQLSAHKATMDQFFEKHIGWQALKEDIAEMYMSAFTEKELKEINAFYITPAGQKVINVVPQLVQQRNQLAMQRLQTNIGELQTIISAQETSQ